MPDPCLQTPSRNRRCVSISVGTLIDHPSLVHAQLIRRRNRGQAVHPNARRRRVDVGDLRLAVFGRQACLVVALPPPAGAFSISRYRERNVTYIVPAV